LPLARAIQIIADRVEPKRQVPEHRGKPVRADPMADLI